MTIKITIKTLAHVRKFCKFADSLTPAQLTNVRVNSSITASIFATHSSSEEPLRISFPVKAATQYCPNIVAIIAWLPGFDIQKLYQANENAAVSPYALLR